MGWLLEKQPAPACPKTSCKLTWVSERLRFLASSFLSCPTTYWFFSKACSNFNSWFGENAVRIRFGFRNGSKNSGKFGPGRRQHVKILSISLWKSKRLAIKWWGFNGRCFDGVYTKARQLRRTWMPHWLRWYARHVATGAGAAKQPELKSNPFIRHQQPTD